jgi:hypothetical protein
MEITPVIAMLGAMFGGLGVKLVDVYLQFHREKVEHPKNETAVADELVKLAALFETGMLTADEYEAAKTKLLG